jgi:hypothetical protein
MFRPSALSPFIYISPSLSKEDLAASPMAINGMNLIRYIDDHGGIPLTQALGSFHRKCVEWAAHEFQWPGYEPEVLYSSNKVLNEADFPPLSILHWALQDLRIIRHYKGTAVLTKKGRAMLGQHGELQALVAEWMLMAPLQDELPSEAAIFWDLRRMLSVISDRLVDWMPLWEFTGLAVPVDLFPTTGPLEATHEASLFIAYNLVRPLTWLGALEQEKHDVSGLTTTERQIRKTSLFEKFLRISLPSGGTAGSLH